MKLLRNPEVGRTLALLAVLSIAATAAAWHWETRFGLFTLVLCLLFMAVWLTGTALRYRRIEGMAAEIDRILHGDERQVALDRYAEGELGILHSEVQKMTVRLREQSQRLVEDKVFLADSIADISHQIRTPLTSINLLVSRLSERDLLEQRRIETVRELYELLSRIDWLITTLLKLSRLDAGTVHFVTESVPLDAMLRKAMGPLLIPMELREQSLDLTAEGEFTGDTGWTGEAVANIIKNCMEHTPAGGRIVVQARENALYTEIVIADNGTGIDKADLPHIFERFYKGKDANDKGFGIGLALARTIITAQNGTIKAENIPPHGAKFTIRFYKGTV